VIRERGSKGAVVTGREHGQEPERVFWVRVCGAALLALVALFTLNAIAGAAAGVGAACLVVYVTGFVALYRSESSSPDREGAE
jgi:hypothetical protein